jgi:hypothetical protein
MTRLTRSSPHWYHGITLITLAVCCALARAQPATSPSIAPLGLATPEETQLANTVRTALLDQLTRIESVECHYALVFDRSNRVAVYRRSGTRFYLATGGAFRKDPSQAIESIHDRRAIGGRETAFDGTTFASRPKLGELHVSDHLPPNLSSMVLPEELVLSIIGEPLGVPDVLGRTHRTIGRFVLVSATPTSGSRRVHLSWRDTSGYGLTIDSLHDLDRGGWPISSVLRRPDNTVIRRVDDVTCTEVMTGLFFPVAARSTLSQPGGQATEVRLVVSDAKLLINTPQSIDRFQLAPFPGDRVLRLGTDTQLSPPADPAWQPPNDLPFPWRPMGEITPPLITRLPSTGPAAATPASPPPGDPAPATLPVADQRMLPVAWIILLGAALLMLLVYLRSRSRK